MIDADDPQQEGKPIYCQPRAVQDCALAHWQEKTPRNRLRQTTTKAGPEMAYEHQKPAGPTTMPLHQIKRETLRKSSDATPNRRVVISADRRSV